MVTNNEIVKQHNVLVGQLKEKCGQKGAETIIGYSIRDCLDDPNKAPLMKEILRLREKLK